MPHPPKPRVVIQKPAVDIVSLEQTISALKTENGELKKQVTESQTVITGLRRDLNGATARLTDITGMFMSQFAIKRFADDLITCFKKITFREIKDLLPALF